MTLEEEEKVLKNKKRLFYLPYPFLMTNLWFAQGKIWVSIAVTLVVIYIIGHQGYFAYKKDKLQSVVVGF